MQDDDKVLEILDSRTPFQASQNYHISKHNEEVAVQGLVTVVANRVGHENVKAIKIDDEEEWRDGKYHIKPDYWLDIVRERKKRWTLEVKTTAYKSFYEDEIIVKAPQVWTCKNQRGDYPNPYVFAATYRKFALIPMGSFWNSKPQEIHFGDVTKKGFKLSVNDYKWHEFFVPLEFERKDE